MRKLLNHVKRLYLRYFYAPDKMPIEQSELWGNGASGTGGSGD